MPRFIVDAAGTATVVRVPVTTLVYTPSVIAVDSNGVATQQFVRSFRPVTTLI